MGLLDNYTGLGDAPRPEYEHQLCIKKLLRYIEDEADLLALPETTVTPGNLNALAPDIIILDDEPESDNLSAPLIAFIEITTRRQLEAIKAKCEALCAQQKISECFVFDYENHRWQHYHNKTGKWSFDSDFNDVDLDGAFC